MLVNVLAIAVDLIHRGPRQQAALRTRPTRADRLVVRVEQHAVLRVERAVVLQMRREDEGFKEPAGMRQVPLHRTGVGHGLDDMIFAGEGFA